jgi:hypothetical protein
MNSQSNNFCNEKHGCCDTDHHHHHTSEAGDAILRANTGSFGPSGITFLATALGVTLNQPIASVTINTQGLDDPEILVQFNGILTATATVAAGITYNFTLFRNCRHSGFREQLRSFTVAQSIAVITLPDSRGLSFAFEDSNESCEECCTYTLELTSVTATVALTLSVTINGTLSVLAVGEEE